MQGLSNLLKSNPTTFYDIIYPSRGPKPQAGCTTESWEAHCRQIFDLPAEGLEEIISHPDPTYLPFSETSIRAALGGCYKGNKSSGPSSLPSQVVKHLHAKNDGTLAKLFQYVSREGLSSARNMARVTPVHKKGDKLLAANYRPVSVLGPVAKLFSTCLNQALEREATLHGWRAQT